MEESRRKVIAPASAAAAAAVALSDAQMAQALHAVYTSDGAMLAEADVIIVAVPTPVDEAHIPDFRPLVGASTAQAST